MLEAVPDQSLTTRVSVSQGHLGGKDEALAFSGLCTQPGSGLDTFVFCGYVSQGCATALPPP